MAWNRPSNDGRARSPSAPRRAETVRPTVRGAIVGAVIVLGAGIAVWWLQGRQTQDTGAESRLENHPRKIAETKPNLPVRRATVEVRRDDAPEKPISPWRKHLLKLAEKDPRLMFQLTNKFARTDRRVFGTTVEQSMDWIFNCVPGDAPMPLLGVDDADQELVERVLRTVNEIKDDDTDAVAGRKDTVMRAKLELAKFLKEGGEYKDFMRYYQNELVRCHEIWLDAQDAVENFTDTEAKDEEVMAYYDAVNKKLTEQGIRELELSDKIRDRLGLPEPGEDGALPPVAEFKGKEQRK